MRFCAYLERSTKRLSENSFCASYREQNAYCVPSNLFLDSYRFQENEIKQIFVLRNAARAAGLSVFLSVCAVCKRSSNVVIQELRMQKH